MSDTLTIQTTRPAYKPHDQESMRYLGTATINNIGLVDFYRADDGTPYARFGDGEYEWIAWP